MSNLALKIPSNLICQTPENGDEILAAMYKYQNHPSIKTILVKFNFSFSFKTVSLTYIEREIKRFNRNKASASSDIPKKNLKQNVDFFSPFILDYVNKSISSSTFPSILKLADKIPYYTKKILDTRKVTIDLNYLKSLKMFFMTKFLLFLKIFSLNIKLVSGKTSVHKAVSWQR